MKRNRRIEDFDVRSYLSLHRWASHVPCIIHRGDRFGLDPANAINDHLCLTSKLTSQDSID